MENLLSEATKILSEGSAKPDKDDVYNALQKVKKALAHKTLINAAKQNPSDKTKKLKKELDEVFKKWSDCMYDDAY
jgi:hypothetical protein